MIKRFSRATAFLNDLANQALVDALCVSSKLLCKRRHAKNREITVIEPHYIFSESWRQCSKFHVYALLYQPASVISFKVLRLSRIVLPHKSI